MARQATADRDDRPVPGGGAGADLSSTPGGTPGGTPAGGVPVEALGAGRRFGGVFGEMLIATVLSFGTAAAMGWQVLRSPSKAYAGYGSDPLLELWSLAWSGHALRPGSGVPASQLFNANTFYPDNYSLAFTDSLLGYGPISWFFHGVGGLMLAFNLVFVFSPALSALGGYGLARQVGANTVGAAVLAAGYAYAPWRTAHFAHLNVLATGPLLIALAMLARGHGFTMSGRRTPFRPVWAMLGWIFASWQLTIGFAQGLPFAYLIAVIGGLVVLIQPIRLIRIRRANRLDNGRPDHGRRAEEQPHEEAQRDGELASEDAAQSIPGVQPAEPTGQRPRRLGWLLLADLLGGALFAAAGALMAYPYFRVQQIDPQAVLAARSLSQVAHFSPRPIGLLTPPSVTGTWSWLTSGRTLISSTSTVSNESRVMPGAILLGLAVLGLFFSTWRWWWRLALALSTLLIAVLAVGTHFPDAAFPGSAAPFVLLWRHVPGWAADRTPGRLMAFGVVALGLLAAGAVTRLCGRAPLEQRGRARPWRARPWRTVAFAVLPILIVLEGWASIPTRAIPAMPAALATARGPIVVLPSNHDHDSTVMFWSANSGFPLVANGTSGITPTTEIQLRNAMLHFPDAVSVAYLRAHGFHTVVVLPKLAGPRLLRDIAQPPAPSLGLTRQNLGDSVLYTVAVPPPTS